jgi:hypothetical protein
MRASSARLVLAALVVSFASTAGASASASRSEMDLARAQDAYDAGVRAKSTEPELARQKFVEAAAIWRRLADEGASSAGLFFNLGNAYVQSGDLGRGIANYLRAQRLDPLDQAIAANLATARTNVPMAISGDAASDLSSIAWWRVVGERTRFVAAAAAWCVFWLLAIAALLHSMGVGGLHVASSRAMRLVRSASLVVALLAGGSVLADRWMASARPLAVVVADKVVLRKGNGEGFDPQIAEALPAGIELLVLERRNAWLRVRLDDGTEGWLRDADVVDVAPTSTGS